MEEQSRYVDLHGALLLDGISGCRRSIRGYRESEITSSLKDMRGLLGECWSCVELVPNCRNHRDR